ncbi:MAG: aqualysin 1 [Acidobacteriota bacterium]|jgi:subtilisin family serine protease|nr:aqualysin 1 [Acidobacteriota bacterium]
MRKYFVPALALTLGVLTCILPTVHGRGPEPTQPLLQQDKFRRSASPVPGQYIVVLDDNAVGPKGDTSHAAEVADELAAAYHGSVLQVFKYTIQGFSVQMSEDEAMAMSTDSRIAFVEEDGEVNTASVQTLTMGTPTYQWGLDRIDQHDTPPDLAYYYQRTGAGVSVYVFDTGIRTTHTEFGGRADTVIDVFNGAPLCNSHGTSVAGIIGGATYGVAKGVRLHSVRVFDCQGKGADSNILHAVDDVTATFQNPSIINMSFAGPPSDSLDATIRNSINSGLVYVAAAGNDDRDACGYSPGRIPGVNTVGAAAISQDHTYDERFVYPYTSPGNISNYGVCLDMFAPAGGPTAGYGSDTGTTTLNGTSAAAAYVSGVAALELEGYVNNAAIPLHIPTTPCRLYGETLGAGSPNEYVFSRTATPYCGVSLSPWVGTIRGTAAQYQPFVPSCGSTGSYSTTTTGLHKGRLTGPMTSDFDLTLMKYVKMPNSMVSTWIGVAGSNGATSCEVVNYTGGPGLYRWRIMSKQGNGDYYLDFEHPQ